MSKSTLYCILFAVVIFIVVSLGFTYDLTYKTLGKLFNVDEVDWKPAEGGAELDCIGFWVHTFVFALVLLAGAEINKRKHFV